MKDLIRKILQEDKNTEVVLNYFRKLWQKETDSGKVPIIPFLDIKRKKLDSFYDEIKLAYFDFVGGKEKAFENFENSIENKTLTEKDLSQTLGINWNLPDTFTFKLYGITYVNYRVGEVDEIDFVFDILDGSFETDGGVRVSWNELMPEEMDDLYVTVSDWIRNLIEDYVEFLAKSYGLKIVSFSKWA